MTGNARNNKLDIIYSRYKDLMHYIANDVLRDYHLAEDAVNQALYRISESLDELDEADSAQTKNFVSVVTKRTAIDMYRKRAKTDALSLNALIADFSGAEPAVKAEDIGILPYALSLLPEEYEKTLILKYEKGYSNKEIAGIMQCSEAKVAKLAVRAKSKLRDILKELNE